MALAIAARELKDLGPAIRAHPVFAFHVANCAYGLVYGYSNCDWSAQPLVIERLACGVAAAACHANPYLSWWTTYWHLAASECRWRGRCAEAQEYKPLQFILQTPSLSEMERRHAQMKK